MYIHRHRARRCQRVHQSRTATRMDEARRPHDGATRSGVATLSSGGAGRGETWRGVHCTYVRYGQAGERQRLRRVADDCRYPQVDLSVAARFTLDRSRGSQRLS